MAQFYADRVAIGSHRAKTPEGYLVCLGIPFARTGFQSYKASELGLKGDGMVKVYRRYDEVFSPSTLASFEGKSVTTPHPPRFLNPDNDAAYSKGHAQNIRQGPKLSDDEYALLCDLVIKDSRLISQIESGSLSELSAGYECEYEPDEHTPDVYYQRGIRGNHVAVVPSGRAGASVKILDSDPTEREESTVAETAALAVVDDKVSVSALTGLLRLFGIGGRPTADSDPGAVERNEEKNEEALRRAKVRNTDDDDKKKGRDADEEEKEMEKEEKGAKDKKKAKDDDDDKKKMTDAIQRLTDAVEELKKEKKKEEDDDEEEEEKEEKKGKKEEEDADLIPVETMTGKELPKNPIPGADAKRALDCLMGLKSLVADSGDKAAINLFNDAVRSIKGKTSDSSKYADLARPKKGEHIRSAEQLSQIGPRAAQDASEASADFVETARKFHRRNPGEAAAEIATAAGKEKH